MDTQAICFYKPFPLKKIGISTLIRYIYECIPVSLQVLLLIFTLAVTLVGMLTPKITNILFSEVVAAGSLRLLLAIAVFSISVSVSSVLISAIKTLIMQRINTQMGISVQAASMSRLLSMPASFFKDYSSGELSSRVQYINSLCSTIASTVFSTGLTSLFSLIYITRLFTYAKMLVVPSLCILSATIAFTVISALVQMRISKQQMDLPKSAAV